ncbi:DUF6493 family protein [Streptomyces sp. M19]
MLVDGCLSRLSRAGRLGIVRGYLDLLTALDLSQDEQARRTLAWVRMLPDAPALAAARAQEVLAGLDEAGRLETEHLIEASRAALFRPEKKIVRAQLAMLDKAMKRDRSRTDELLLVAAEAFGHEEHTLQERALALAVRHRKHASATVLAELAAGRGSSTWTCASAPPMRSARRSARPGPGPGRRPTPRPSKATCCRPYRAPSGLSPRRSPPPNSPRRSAR